MSPRQSTNGKTLNPLSTFRGELQDLGLHLKEYIWHKCKVECLVPLQSPPALGDVQFLEDVIARLAELGSQFCREKERCVVLNPVSAPPELADTRTLQSLIG